MSRQLAVKGLFVILWIFYLQFFCFTLVSASKRTAHLLNNTKDIGNEKVIGNATEDDDNIIGNFIRRYPIKLWKDHGFFQEDYLKEFNKHWLKFAPPDRRSHIILAIIYVIIMFTGMFGNLLVIVLFLSRKCLRSPANILIVNLAVSDFLMMSKMPIFIYNSIYQGPALGEYACRYFGFLGGLSGTVSICTLAVISLDRYHVVKFPLNRKMTHFKLKIILTIVWLYAAAFSVVPLLDLGLGQYVPEGYLTSCSFDYLTNSSEVKLFIFSFFVAAWLIPFIVITFSYLNIIYVVILARRNVTNGRVDSKKHMKQEESRKQEIHLALIVLLIISLWFIAWTPYATVALLGITGNEALITPLGSMVPALFCKTASCVDPFVYALTHPRFKKELRYFLCNRRPLERSYTGATSRGSSIYTRRTTRRSCPDNQSIEETNKLEEISLVNVRCELPSGKSWNKSRFSSFNTQVE